MHNVKHKVYVASGEFNTLPRSSAINKQEQVYGMRCTTSSKQRGWALCGHETVAAIKSVFIKALLKRDVNDRERDMLSLPARLGGLGIGKPTEECLIAHTNSVYICAPLVRLIKRQEYDLDPSELSREVKSLRLDIDNETDTRLKAKLDVILDNAPAELKKAVQAASEKGASSWVTAVPSYDHGTILHKSDFIDACYMRYGWQMLDLRKAFSLQRCARLRTWWATHHTTQ